MHRLLVFLLLASLSIAVAAPRSLHSDEDSSEEGASAEDQGLQPALLDIQRRKRDMNDPNYSNYRYRYPIYKKRAYHSSPQYEDEFESNSYEDDEDEPREPMFRKRNNRLPLVSLSRGQFTDDPLPPDGYSSMYKKRSRLDWESPYDPQMMEGHYGPGRPYSGRSGASSNPPSSRKFYEMLEELSHRYPYGPVTPGHIAEQEMALAALANERELLANMQYARKRSMIRKKRSAARLQPEKSGHKLNSTLKEDEESTANEHHPKVQSVHGIKMEASGTTKTDRTKRDFSPFGTGSPYENMDDDFLTREYFKTIARSVGNKKKRMAFARFRADKRSPAIQEVLSNPEMLSYLDEKLRDAEQEVAKEAQEDISQLEANPKAQEIRQYILENSLDRLDAIDQMRKGVRQLQLLQEEPEIPGLFEDVNSGEVEKKALAKRRKTMAEIRDEDKKKKRNEGLERLLMNSRRDECPVLDRVAMNCADVSDLAGDTDHLLMPSCISHEVCYMCGASMKISAYECDAVLSAALEASCSGMMDCLKSAGDTFELLSNADRYDSRGTCTRDPCIRQILHSR